jgi:hypothetical protein
MKSLFLLRIPFIKLEALHLIGRSAPAAAAASGDDNVDRMRRVQRPRDRRKSHCLGATIRPRPPRRGTKPEMAALR